MQKTGLAHVSLYCLSCLIMFGLAFFLPGHKSMCSCSLLCVYPIHPSWVVVAAAKCLCWTDLSILYDCRQHGAHKNKLTQLASEDELHVLSFSECYSWSRCFVQVTPICICLYWDLHLIWHFQETLILLMLVIRANLSVLIVLPRKCDTYTCR